MAVPEWVVRALERHTQGKVVSVKDNLITVDLDFAWYTYEVVRVDETNAVLKMPDIGETLELHK